MKNLSENRSLNEQRERPWRWTSNRFISCKIALHFQAFPVSVVVTGLAKTIYICFGTINAPAALSAVKCLLYDTQNVLSPPRSLGNTAE